MKNKKIVWCFLLVSSTYVYANYQNSLKFSSKVEKTCGLVFKNSGSIAFKHEEPKYIGEFEIISNLYNKEKLVLKIKNFQKSVNLLNVNNSMIYVVIDRFKKIKIQDMLVKGIEIGSKFHKIYIYIDTKRNSINSGKTTVSFELEPICKGSKKVR